VRRIRLNTSVSVVRTTAGLHLQSDLHTLRIDTSDLNLLTRQIVPLLDGSRDQKSVIASVKGYSRASLLTFLNTLADNGLLETVPDGDDSIDKDSQKQHEFCALTNHPEEIIKCIDQYAKLRWKWADERTGIIRYLITEPPDPANFKFVWTSEAVLRRSTFAKERSSKSTGFGVGVSSAEATTKAVAEALELHAASKCSEADLLYSSAGSLSGDFLDPRALSLYDRAQYRDPAFPFERFHSRSRIAWTHARWLDTHADVLVPAFLTYFGAPASLNQNFAEVTTSGLATGTSLEDASMRAICELVERDAFMTTWLARVPSQRLIPDAIDEVTRRIVDEFEARGLGMRIYLLKAGIDIPVVLCLIPGDGKNWPGATVGLGAHADPVIATRRAILEQALIGPALRREMLDSQRRIPRRANQVATPLDHALYYVPKGRARAFDFLDPGKLDPVLLAELAQPKKITLDLYRKRLQDAGVRVAIKNLTPTAVAAESPFCVVRALGTNLQPLHFGFGLARSASRRLRCVAKKQELNPVPHPLG
jgi:ribosomal protein S12 methylthiotransferase accessory factor